MTSKEKIIEKLKNSPQNLRYSEIETLFENDNFIIEWRKGSHKKITYKKNPIICVIIPLHEKDCLVQYKIKLRKLYLLTNKDLGKK